MEQPKPQESALKRREKSFHNRKLATSFAKNLAEKKFSETGDEGPPTALVRRVSSRPDQNASTLRSNNLDLAPAKPRDPNSKKSVRKSIRNMFGMKSKRAKSRRAAPPPPPSSSDGG